MKKLDIGYPFVLSWVVISYYTFMFLRYRLLDTIYRPVVEKGRLRFDSRSGQTKDNENCMVFTASLFGVKQLKRQYEAFTEWGGQVGA